MNISMNSMAQNSLAALVRVGGVILCLVFLGCGPSKPASAEGDAIVVTRLDQLYRSYLDGNAEQARNSLLECESVLSKAKLQKIDAVAHGYWLTYSRLFVLESWVGNSTLANAYFLKARFWYLRKLELSGDNTESAMNKVSVFDEAFCKQLVIKWDSKNTNGRGATYSKQ